MPRCIRPSATSRCALLATKDAGHQRQQQCGHIGFPPEARLRVSPFTDL
jgi:hypothetical protein